MYLDGLFVTASYASTDFLLKSFNDDIIIKMTSNVDFIDLVTIE